MFTAQIVAHALDNLLSSEQASSFDSGAFAMPPMGLDAVEPGTLGWQPTRDSLNALLALALLLPCDLIVLTKPGLDVFADMPGGVSPQQPACAVSWRDGLLAKPLQKVGGHLADGPAIHAAQPHLSMGPVQASLATQRFRIRSILAHLPFYQPQRLLALAPGMPGGLRHPTP